MSYWLNNVVLNESVEFEYAIISFLVAKSGGVIIIGGFIFGGNMVHFLNIYMFKDFWKTYKMRTLCIWSKLIIPKIFYEIKSRAWHSMFHPVTLGQACTYVPDST